MASSPQLTLNLGNQKCPISSHGRPSAAARNWRAKCCRCWPAVRIAAQMSGPASFGAPPLSLSQTDALPSPTSALVQLENVRG